GEENKRKGDSHAANLITGDAGRPVDKPAPASTSRPTGVGLTRFRGHNPKGGYDVPDAIRNGNEGGRRFTVEFKVGAVRLVLEEGRTVGAAARDLDLTESSLRKWVEQARADRTNGKPGLTTAEREELARPARAFSHERALAFRASAAIAKS
ncbi:MAG: transposase, partial [Vicinamibacterales bacterium]